MARALRRDPEAVLSGEADDRGHVLLIRREDDCRGPLVHGQVEGLAGGIPVGIRCGRDAAGKSCSERLEICGLSGGQLVVSVRVEGGREDVLRDEGGILGNARLGRSFAMLISNAN